MPHVKHVPDLLPLIVFLVTQMLLLIVVLTSALVTPPLLVITLKLVVNRLARMPTSTRMLLEIARNAILYVMPVARDQGEINVRMPPVSVLLKCTQSEQTISVGVQRICTGTRVPELA